MTAKSIRVPDALWLAAQAKADQRGETVSEAIRKFLERYTMEPGWEEIAQRAVALSRQSDIEMDALLRGTRKP
jgi:macrodomain Ter protein organizer (MatP/YcbG family)